MGFKAGDKVQISSNPGCSFQRDGAWRRDGFVDPEYANQVGVIGHLDPEDGDYDVYLQGNHLYGQWVHESYLTLIEEV